MVNGKLVISDHSEHGMLCGRVSAGAAQAGAPGCTTLVWPPPPVARFAACARPASKRRSRLSFQRMPCGRVSAGAARAGSPGRSTPSWPQPPAVAASKRRSRLSFQSMPCSRVSAGAARVGAPSRTTPVWPQPPAARFAASGSREHAAFPAVFSEYAVGRSHLFTRGAERVDAKGQTLLCRTSCA
jgi:hypothetical protein